VNSHPDSFDHRFASLNMYCQISHLVWLLGGSEGNVFAVNSDGVDGPVCDDSWDMTNVRGRS